MDQGMRLLVFPVKDLAKAKALYRELLGVDPYADAPYYVGFRTGDLEIGLDPRGQTAGPLPYWEVDDIRRRLKELVGFYRDGLERYGVTLADPDGFRVVLVPEEWLA